MEYLCIQNHVDIYDPVCSLHFIPLEGTEEVIETLDEYIDAHRCFKGQRYVRAKRTYSKADIEMIKTLPLHCANGIIVYEGPVKAEWKEQIRRQHGFMGTFMGYKRYGWNEGEPEAHLEDDFL